MRREGLVSASLFLLLFGLTGICVVAVALDLWR